MASKQIVWVGRLTGPKGTLARELAYSIFPRFPDVQFTLVGGPARPSDWPEPAPNVVFAGQVADVDQFYVSADLVIGAGRVALEAMRREKPVMAVGEGCYVGIVNHETISAAKATNFGDCFAPPFIDYAKLAQDIASFLGGTLPADCSLYQQFLSEYDRLHVNKQLRDIVYRQALATAALRRFSEVPVLMYHRVVKKDLAESRHKIYTTTERLHEHFSSLRRRGYEAVTFKDLVTGRKVHKPVILTFDDGYQDNFDNLLPLLKKFSYKAVIFVLGDRTVQANTWDVQDGEPSAPLMTDEQVRHCHTSGLVEIASHGLSHSRLPELDALASLREMNNSKANLENIIGDEVISFAYPYGVYSPREVEQVKEAGYLFGIGTVNGPLNFADDLYRIRRIQMRPRDKGLKFWHKTCGFYLRYCYLKRKDF